MKQKLLGSLFSKMYKPNQFMEKFCTITCFLLLSSGLCQSQVLISDNFNYTTGNLVGNGGWTQTGTTATNPIQVSSSVLSYASGYPGLGGNSVALVTSGQDIYYNSPSTVSSGSIYCSFVVNVSAAQATGDYFFHFGTSATNTGTFYGRLYAKSSGAGYVIGMGKTSLTPTYGTTVLAFNTSYVIVVKYTFNSVSTTDDAVYAYVFSSALPSTEPLATPEVSVTADASTDATSIFGIALRQGSALNSATLSLDGVRAANSWLGAVGNTWTGATNTTFTTITNWSAGAVPTTTDNVAIPVTSNSPSYTSSSTVASLSIANGATLNNSGFLTVTNGLTNAGTINSGTINVGGSLTNSGSVAIGGTITLNGSSAQTISGTGSITNLTTNNSAGVTVTSGASNTQTISNILTLQAGVLTANGNIVLASTAAQTAYIDKVDGTVNTGSIAGNVTIQRYIPASGRKKYTLVSSPASGSTINAAWQEGGATVSGLGTHITNGQISNGFDGPATSTASIFTYNDGLGSGSKWSALANTDVNTLKAGNGYLLFVRGDRSENRPVTGNSSNTTLRAAGTVLTGNVTFATSGGTTGTPALLGGNGNYTLIANPYPSAINWNEVDGSSVRYITLSGVADAFTVYDPNIGTFATYDNGSGVTSPQTGVATGVQGKYIQSGQAFFVKATGATPSIVFREGAKNVVSTAIGNTVFGETAPKQQLNLNIYRTTDNVFADGVVAIFGNYKTAISKFTNFNETFALARNGQTLSIEGRPTVTGNDTLFFSLSNFGKREYSLVIDGSNFTNTTATLEDAYTGIKQPIDLSGVNKYNFTVTDDVKSSSNNRFIVTFGSTAKQIGDVVADNSLFVKMSPNPVSNQLQVSFKTADVDNTTIHIINSLGQIVKTVEAGKVNAGNISIPVANLSTGVYSIQLLSGGKNIATQKLVKE